MSKCFRKGFKYVFTTKKFKKVMGSSSTWAKECNGRTVSIVNSQGGRIRELGYSVIPEWCKCIGKADE